MFSFGLCLFNKIHQEHYLWYRHQFNLILSPNFFFALLSLITYIISKKLYHRNTNHDRDAWNKKNIFTTVEDNFNVTHLLYNVWKIIVIWLLRFFQQSFFHAPDIFFFFMIIKHFFFLFFASMKNINHDLNIYLPCIQFSICSISLSYW